AIASAKSPVSLTRSHEVPHIFTPKPRLRPAEFLATCAKRLLQHNQVQSGHGRKGFGRQLVTLAVQKLIHRHKIQFSNSELSDTCAIGSDDAAVFKMFYAPNER